MTLMLVMMFSCVGIGLFARRFVYFEELSIHARADVEKSILP